MALREAPLLHMLLHEGEAALVGPDHVPSYAVSGASALCGCGWSVTREMVPDVMLAMDVHLASVHLEAKRNECAD